MFTKEKRSDVMSRIRGSGNKDTEFALATFFRRHHIAGWRRGSKLPGRPDFVFAKRKLAVFAEKLLRRLDRALRESTPGRLTD